MKKIIMFLFTALMLGSTQQAQAQKWLKQLGKAIDSADQALKKYPATSGMSVYHNGIDAKFISCVRASEQVWIDFELKSYASTDKELPIKADVIGQKGEKFRASYLLGGQNVNQPWPKIFIPARMTFSYRIVLRNVPVDCTVLQKAVLGFGDDEFDFGAIAISEPNNTNASNVYCGLPTIQFDLRSVERDGKNLKFNFTMTSKDGTIPINFQHSGNIMYDTAGNIYSAMMFNFSEQKDYIELQYDIPVAGSIIVRDVPENIPGFKMLQCYFFSGNVYRYFIKIKDK